MPISCRLAAQCSIVVSASAASGFRLAWMSCANRPTLACKSSKNGFQLTLPRAWLEEHPMTEAALEQETEEWRALDVKLEVRSLAREDRVASES